MPPNSNVAVHQAHCVAAEIAMAQHTHDKLIFCGDFNLPNVHWTNDSLGLRVTKNCRTLADHFAYFVMIDLQTQVIKTDYFSYNFRNHDFTRLNLHLSD